jgi:hypothetical protein
MVETADLIVTNARIITAERGVPRAEAIAVAHGTLLAVGSASGAERFHGPETLVEDARGAVIMPGFVDVHNHHAHAGKADLFELTFSASDPLERVIDAVHDYADQLGPADWVIGSSWGTGLLDELSRVSARVALDAASGGRPVLLTDDSHHNRWANTRALELAGITRDTPDPQGGVIVRDPATGEPTGILLEAAGLIVASTALRSSRLTAAQYEDASERAIGILHSFGITAFQDAAVSLETMRALHALDRRGMLAAWVVSSMTANDQIFGYDTIGDELIAQGEKYRSPHHRPDFIKIFLDGTPPAHTGAFLRPYLPDADHGDHYHGTPTMSPDELLGWLQRTARLGISAKIHCTGDASVRMVLDAVQIVRAEGHRDVRYQIAHGQFISPEDLPRLAELDVAADISPFLWFPGVIADALSHVRPAGEVAGLQPNRSLIDSGALVAGGSDWPVSETPNAWEGIQGLVTRMDPHREHPGSLGPNEAITLTEAIEVFTVNGATAMGLGDVTGSLRPGKSADFIVVDRDPYETPPSELAGIGIVETWFAGESVFRADARDQLEN